MPNKKNKAGPVVTLEEALAEEAYEWMVLHAPRLLDAITHEIEGNGRSPDDVRMIVSRNVGPERQALAMRCYQAARWMYYFPGPEEA